MDGLGDIFGGLGDMIGEMFGEEAGAEGAMGLAALFGSEGGRRAEAAPIVYARYLCGGPRELHINDR
jgi:hypothetical protein